MGKKQPKKVQIVEEKQTAIVAAPLVPVTSGLSREELQAKLRAKMDEFKHKRGADVEKNKKKQTEKYGRRETKLAEKKAKKEAVAAKKGSAAPVAVATPVLVESGKQIFSKFDFGTAAEGSKKVGNASVTPKNPKQALQKVLARTERIQQIATTDAAKAAQMQRSDAWSKAIQKAQGLTIKDDPRLLKKSIQRLEKAKDRRAEGWKERKQATEDGQAMRQKKRTENIEARKEAKKSGSNKKGGASKGKMSGSGGVKKNQKRPGFEGSHFKKVQKSKK